MNATPPATQPTEIAVEYSPNVVTFFANHVQAVGLMEEVYLECCMINPNIGKPIPTRPDGSIAQLPAVCEVRVILTREHAKRLAKLILDQNP